MADKPTSTLARLDDSDLTLANAADDVRGREVRDRNGEEVGNVDGLVIDEDERRVRFLEVGSGGFLGLGEKKRLIPVDAVTSVDDAAVHVDLDRDRVAGSSDYDPEIVQRSDFYSEVYDYYGYAPYWAPGYVYPPFPYR